MQIVSFFVRRMRKLADSQVANQQRAAQLRTMASVIRASSYFFVIFFFLLQVLPIFNIDLKPLLASAGVIGLGISFGAQSIFKDMLTGIFILIEDQYNVGDVVKIAGLQGTVEDMTLRVTTLRDNDGTLNIIPNSQVATVQNLSRQYSVATLNLSVDSSANPDTVMAALREIANDVRKDKAFADVVLADPEIRGVDKIAGREVVYPVNMRVRANQKDGVLRELRRRIILKFDKSRYPARQYAAHAHPAEGPHTERAGTDARELGHRASFSCVSRSSSFVTGGRQALPLQTTAQLLPFTMPGRCGSVSASAGGSVLSWSCRRRITLLLMAKRAMATASRERAAASSPMMHICTGGCTMRCIARPNVPA